MLTKRWWRPERRYIKLNRKRKQIPNPNQLKTKLINGGNQNEI